MAEIRVLACEYPKCGRYEPEAGVCRFDVRAEGERWVIDLCVDHAQPLMDILSKAPARKGRTKLADLRVSSPEQIPRKRAPGKKAQ